MEFKNSFPSSNSLDEDRKIDTLLLEEEVAKGCGGVMGQLRGVCNLVAEFALPLFRFPRSFPGALCIASPNGEEMFMHVSDHNDSDGEDVVVVVSCCPPLRPRERGGTRYTISILLESPSPDEFVVGYVGVYSASMKEFWLWGSAGALCSSTDTVDLTTLGGSTAFMYKVGDVLTFTLDTMQGTVTLQKKASKGRITVPLSGISPNDDGPCDLDDAVFCVGSSKGCYDLKYRIVYGEVNVTTHQPVKISAPTKQPTNFMLSFKRM